MSTHYYPSTTSVSPYWGDPVATSGSLPATGTTGEIRLVLDTDDLYEWNGSAWERITQNTADVTGPSSSVDNELVLFSSTTGKVIKRASGNGYVKAASGVASFQAVPIPVADGGTNSTTALNNNRIMRSSGGAIGEAAAITASRALVSDANGIPTHSAVTSTEIGYVAGVTSAVQTQLDAKLNKSGGTMTGDLTLNADPDSAMKAATKQYVDSVAAGLDVKPSVRAASTADLTLSGEQTIDGVAVVAGDRVLVKNQATASQNGIYVASAGAWSRATDMDSWTEIPGAFCFVEEGTLYADTAFVCTANAGGSLGSTSVTWSQFAGAGTYTADGQGIELTGTQFGLELDGSTLSKSASGLRVAAQTASRALVSDGSGNLSAATTTSTEIGYVNGVTSAIQTQLNSIRAPKSTVAVSSNVTLTDQAMHLVDTSSARSLTLPSPATTSWIGLKDATGNCATNNITLVRAGSEKIETVAASFTLDTDLGAWILVSDGTDWFII